VNVEYFDRYDDLPTLKKRYRELAKKYHPDKQGGSTEIMQQINEEFRYCVDFQDYGGVENIDFSLFDIMEGIIKDMHNRRTKFENPLQFYAEVITSFARVFVLRPNNKRKHGTKN